MPGWRPLSWGLLLTVRNKKAGDQTSMCGVPHHSVGGAINKLLAGGQKVAICDQVEDPKKAKGLVKREVTRILTPGMVFDPETLEAHSPHYLMAFDQRALSFMDSTTGECFYYLVTDRKRRGQLMETLHPVEVVLSKTQGEETFESFKPPSWQGVMSLQEEVQGEEDPLKWGTAQGGETQGETLPLEAPFENLQTEKPFPESARRLMAYARKTQGGLALPLTPFEKRAVDQSMEVSPHVFSHLEIFKTYKGEKQGTLFSVMNKTRTAGGGRLLKSWLQFPLRDQGAIEKRLKAVKGWTQSWEKLKDLRQGLGLVGDMERRLGKGVSPTAQPRDLKALGQSLQGGLALLPLMEDFSLKKEVKAKLPPLQETLDQALSGDLPPHFREGGFIAKGFREDLDELIQVAQHSQAMVREMEEQERQLTGIPSLKIRYNNVFGYYIEVSHTHKAKVPLDRYQRKQTLTNAERFTTEELHELEKKVITAKTQRVRLELEIFEELKSQVRELSPLLLALAQGLSRLDVFTSLAWLALENNYVQPQVVEQGAIELEGSRHPVVEEMLQTPFVANDLRVEAGQSLLITGPNMAGKSTLMRQVALTCLMAQVGSFVPARRASLPLWISFLPVLEPATFSPKGFPLLWWKCRKPPRCSTRPPPALWSF